MTEDKLEAMWRKVRKTKPQLMPALVRLCHQARERGFTHWSVDALFHVLRWESASTTGDHGLKMNNNYTSLAARDLMRENPELADMFSLRTRKPRSIESQIH